MGNCRRKSTWNWSASLARGPRRADEVLLSGARGDVVRSENVVGRACSAPSKAPLAMRATNFVASRISSSEPVYNNFINHRRNPTSSLRIAQQAVEEGHAGRDWTAYSPHPPFLYHSRAKSR